MSKLFDLVYRNLYRRLEQNGVTMGVETVQVCQVAAMDVLLATTRRLENSRLTNVRVNSKAVQTETVRTDGVIYISDSE